MTSQDADRPGPAGASRRSKITPEREREFFDAVLEQIRTCGYDAVTMEGVAASTRCSKSTLYRQWRTKPQFVAAALRSSARARFALIDTGTLAGDLREAARCAGSGHRRTRRCSRRSGTRSSRTGSWRRLCGRR